NPWRLSSILKKQAFSLKESRKFAINGRPPPFYRAILKKHSLQVVIIGGLILLNEASLLRLI
ncbi:MAG: hypothetical protein ACJZ1O_03075, partial [Candidatus Neomarinimicrobiota bacterium]